eukprot:jgi/Chlat1/6347/Chrsp44S09060
MGHLTIWCSHPRGYGPGSRMCRVCGNPHGLVRKYGIMLCRQCFRICKPKGSAPTRIASALALPCDLIWRYLPNMWS